MKDFFKKSVDTKNLFVFKSMTYTPNATDSKSVELRFMSVRVGLGVQLDACPLNFIFTLSTF